MAPPIMKTVAIIQARMDSKRLPGKVLKKLGSMLVLERVEKRLRECKLLDDIVIATSLEITDDQIANWCMRNNVKLFRGSLNDVLDRYYQAGCKYGANSVVRITGDCPLIDPDVVDKVIAKFNNGSFDAAGLHGEFPDGLDCQVFSMEALKIAWQNATSSTDREHVGSYIENTNPRLFKYCKVELFYGLGHHRWTLDEPKDFEFLSSLIEILEKKNKYFYTEEILQCLDQFPELLKLNNSIIRNEGYLMSLRKENDHG